MMWRVTLDTTRVFFFQAEDGIRDDLVTGVQTCALPISAQLMKQFAACLKEKLAQERPAAPGAASASPPPTQPSPPIEPTAAPAPTAKPIAGFALIAKVIWSWITGVFRRSYRATPLPPPPASAACPGR